MACIRSDISIVPIAYAWGTIGWVKLFVNVNFVHKTNNVRTGEAIDILAITASHWRICKDDICLSAWHKA